MTDHDTGLRATIFHDAEIDHLYSPTSRLLTDRGYSLMRSTTVDHTIDLLADERNDLLIVDTPVAADRAALLRRLATLPVDRRPGEVAIYVEATTPELTQLRHTVAPTNVNLLVRPLHLHKLLTVLRRIEGATPQTATV